MERQTRLGGPLMLLLLMQPLAQACFTQSYLYQRRESASRQRSSHVFAYGEYQPKSDEQSIQASGVAGPVLRNSHKLLRSGSSLLIFTSKRRSVFMTRRCKEKLEQLALLVRNQWNGDIRIRVHNAWVRKPEGDWDNQVGHDGLEPLHYSGRAVDMSLVTVQPGQFHREATLGKLAQLAYYQAYFDYCKVLRDTVHCSVKSDEPLDSDWLACFPGTSTVYKRRADGGGGALSGVGVPINRLEIGDEVLTASEDGHMVWTSVIGYHHRVDGGSLMYIRVTLVNGSQSLEVSPSHLLFARTLDNVSESEPIYASLLTPGHRLLLAPTGGDSPGPARWEKIVRVETVRRAGRFAPITAAGHLMVDGVWASSYAHTRLQRAAHLIFAPLRWLHAACGGAGVGSGGFDWSPCAALHRRGDSNGIHWYTGAVYAFAQRLAPAAALYPN